MVMFSYPELVFVLLVMLLPMLGAFVLSASLGGWLVRYLIGAAAGFVIWFAVILLIVRPKFRDP